MSYTKLSTVYSLIDILIFKNEFSEYSCYLQKSRNSLVLLKLTRLHDINIDYLRF